jgi:predicted HicB family RNase H-like nuclease
MKGKKKNNIFSARIDPSLHDAVKEYCVREGYKIQSFLEEALTRELEIRKKER